MPGPRQFQNRHLLAKVQAVITRQRARHQVPGIGDVRPSALLALVRLTAGQGLRHERIEARPTHPDKTRPHAPRGDFTRPNFAMHRALTALKPRRGLSNSHPYFAHTESI